MSNKPREHIQRIARRLNMTHRPLNQPGLLAVLTDSLVPVLVTDGSNPDRMPSCLQDDIGMKRKDAISFFELRPLSDETEERLAITSENDGRHGCVVVQWRGSAGNILKDISHELGHAWCFNEGCPCMDMALRHPATQANSFKLSIQSEIHANLHALQVIKPGGFAEFVLKTVKVFENDPEWHNRKLVAQYYAFCVLKHWLIDSVSAEPDWTPIGIDTHLRSGTFNALIESDRDWFRVLYAASHS